MTKNPRFFQDSDERYSNQRSRRLGSWLLAISCVALAGVAAAGWSIASAEETTAALVQQIARADRAGKGDELLRLANELIAQDPRSADAFYFRGREHFRRGAIEKSVADFDRLVQLRPEREPPQWERGIALYYARQYARGAKQFELYQTYDSRDVENSVWRYLCLAKVDGVEKARSTMLPIENDPRVPMMEVFGMFAGKVTPQQVLAAAHAGEPDPVTLAGRLFYAHLYLGLYYDAAGNDELCRKYIDLAADEKLNGHPRINSYMWAVARVHQGTLQQNK
jgi:lipoprotein NlpI